jgi:steroid 5-alpha reductase family enzyme
MVPSTSVLLALATILGMAFLLWIVSVMRKDASIIDPAWGLGFVFLAWFYFITSEVHTSRRPLVVALVTVWGLRLSAYLFWRNRGKGEDYRYREMRDIRPRSFALRSLFTVFFLQAVILWLVSLSLYQAFRAPTPRGISLLDAVGVLVFAVGLFFEVGGDWQLGRFRSDLANRGRVLDRGLWRYTRHPNYFGDALVWWGLFLIALATPSSAWTLASPVLMTFLLMRVSGVTLLEKKLGERKPQYRDYMRRTSAFFPWPPKRREDADKRER